MKAARVLLIGRYHRGVMLGVLLVKLIVGLYVPTD
jgi:hypothetical protein